MTEASWQPKIAAINAENAAARRLAEDSVFGKALSSNQAVAEKAQAGALDLASVFPVLLSFVPYPILERMIGHSRGNNSHNPNRQKAEQARLARGQS